MFSVLRFKPHIAVGATVSALAMALVGMLVSAPVSALLSPVVSAVVRAVVLVAALVVSAVGTTVVSTLVHKLVSTNTSLVCLTLPGPSRGPLVHGTSCGDAFCTTIFATVLAMMFATVCDPSLSSQVLVPLEGWDAACDPQANLFEPVLRCPRHNVLHCFC